MKVVYILALLVMLSASIISGLDFFAADEFSWLRLGVWVCAMLTSFFWVLRCVSAWRPSGEKS